MLFESLNAGIYDTDTVCLQPLFPSSPRIPPCLAGRDGLLGYRTVLDAWLSFQTKTKILPAGGLRGDRRWDTMSIECYIELS